MTKDVQQITVGVLALQGAFSEHIQLLRQAAKSPSLSDTQWTFSEIRTPPELSRCDALIIPGGESTTMSLVAARSNILEPLREFVKYEVHRNPTWGTCAGLILLAEAANRTKKGGQELIGGLDVRVNRNHFGRQVESFIADLDLPFLAEADNNIPTIGTQLFKAVFIRAPVVEKILPLVEGPQIEEQSVDETVIAPSRAPEGEAAKEVTGKPVEIMAALPGRAAELPNKIATTHTQGNIGDIIAVRQGNVFGTSFHPELTNDSRIHVWWLKEVRTAIEKRRG